MSQFLHFREVPNGGIRNKISFKYKGSFLQSSWALKVFDGTFWYWLVEVIAVDLECSLVPDTGDVQLPINRMLLIR